MSSNNKKPGEKERDRGRSRSKASRRRPWWSRYIRGNRYHKSIYRDKTEHRKRIKAEAEAESEPQEKPRRDRLLLVMHANGYCEVFGDPAVSFVEVVELYEDEDADTGPTFQEASETAKSIWYAGNLLATSAPKTKATRARVDATRSIYSQIDNAKEDFDAMQLSREVRSLILELSFAAQCGVDVAAKAVRQIASEAIKAREDRQRRLHAADPVNRMDRS